MSVIALIVTLVLMGLVFWLVLWFVDYVGLPEPFNKVIKVIVGLVILLYLLGVILGGAPIVPVHT